MTTWIVVSLIRVTLSTMMSAAGTNPAFDSDWPMTARAPGRKLVPTSVSRICRAPCVTALMATLVSVGGGKGCGVIVKLTVFELPPPGAGLVTATPYSIASPDVLKLEIAEIRSQGYAVNRGEWHVESCGIAVPLRDQSGEAVAAIGVACHASRFSDGFVRRVSDPALIHAREISRALGYKEPSVPWLAYS